VNGTYHFTELGVTAKNGFGTGFIVSKYYPEALAADGKVLGKSPKKKTYMSAQNSTAAR
jgi:hypothetical protein